MGMHRISCQIRTPSLVQVCRYLLMCKAVQVLQHRAWHPRQSLQDCIVLKVRI